jgi:hypothetical protein
MSHPNAIIESTPKERETMKVSIESDCVCQTENDETGEYGASNECFGDCWEWQSEDVFYVIQEWQKKNGYEDDTPILITGKNMNWNHVSGWSEATPKTILSKLTLDGDFRLTFEFDEEENIFNCIRSSHDEVGAYFEFVPIPVREEE